MKAASGDPPLSVDTIEIAYIQNQLLIWAIPDGGHCSHLLLNCASSPATWDVHQYFLHLSLPDMLKPGNYTLAFVGVTWSDKGRFDINLEKGGTIVKGWSMGASGPLSYMGACCSKTVSITV